MASVDMSPAGQSLVELFQKLSTADDASTAANALASHVKTSGLDCWAEAGLTEKLKDALEGKDKAAAVGAAAAVQAFIDTHEAAAEPYVYSLLTPLLAKVSDRAPEVCQAAEAAARALVTNTSAAAIKPKLMPNLLSGMDRVQKPPTKVLALNLLADLAETHPTKVADCMSNIISAATELIGDAKKDVKEAAHRAMTAACQVCGNHDIQPFVPILVSCMANHDELHNCIHKLAATTFVQSVEEPALAILVPLLCMGLLDRARAIKRKSCLIVDNMSKLVDDPTCAAPFMPRIMPLLERAADEISDPEARSVAERALVTLRKIDTEGKALVNQRRPDEVLVKQQLADALAAASIEAPSSAAYTQAVEYVCVLCCELILRKIFESDIWANAAVVGYLAPFLGEAAAKAVCSDFLQRCKVEDEKMAAAFEEEEEEGEDLCKCDFSLAYGAKILLNNTSLHLKRGKRYGLCGPNGCGKSTLMRAIANGQVEGFPPPDVLKTVYVEHDLDDSVAEVTVVDLLLMDERFEGRHEEVVSTLASVGYCDGREKMLVSELSGGWRMKLALARAMLLHPDILLLDEPTNHLDVTNVAWLQDYLVGLEGVSSMIVSHDSSFLDTVCTHIIHYEMRKLKVYRGNLSRFVQKVPEAQSYYELEATPISWRFPEPGYLEGVKTKDKALLKMQDVSFTYPTADKPTLTGISLQVSLSSRVACIGGNGAGKSTLIKVLTGEMEATAGTVWRHPNARIAYVAQHAFHHIEQHLDWTPNQYIQWRYASGEDREEQEKVSRKIDEDEEKKMKEAVKIDGVKRKVEKVLGRRKAKKGGYEYEVQWENTGPEANSWMSRRDLEDLGFGKLVNEVDAAEAARLGLMTRPLTSAAIEKHLNDIGLEPEFATHSQMRGLSGGQKVKVVIGAAMWNNPHIVVLDEPTNFLDRDSLGAMAGAIREYDGGVVIISHNQEFTKKLCPEVWTVANGSMTMTGNNYKLQDKTKVSQKKIEEMTDALGNTVKVKGPAKKLSRKELKAKERARAQKRAAGLAVSDDEDDF